MSNLPCSRASPVKKPATLLLAENILADVLDVAPSQYFSVTILPLYNMISAVELLAPT